VGVMDFELICVNMQDVMTSCVHIFVCVHVCVVL